MLVLVSSNGRGKLELVHGVVALPFGRPVKLCFDEFDGFVLLSLRTAATSAELEAA